MDEIYRRLGVLDERLDKLNGELAKLIGSQQTVEMLLKWVVLPLIVILGGLVGVKIVLP